MRTYQIVVETSRTMFGKSTGKQKAMIFPTNGASVMDAEGKTAKEAKSVLINALGEMAANASQRGYVFSVDGTVFSVYFDKTAWCYDMIGADRNYPSSCMMSNVHDFNSAMLAAEDHATGSFGGVLKILR